MERAGVAGDAAVERYRHLPKEIRRALATRFKADREARLTQGVSWKHWLAKQMETLKWDAGAMSGRMR